MQVSTNHVGQNSGRCAYELTVFRSEEADNTCNVLGSSTPLERAVLSHEGLDLVGGPLGGGAGDVVPGVGGEHVALDTTGAHAVDGDAADAKVGSKSLGHANDGHLGGVVERVVLNAQQTSGDGGHEDQTAVVLEVLPGSLADEELGAGIEVEDLVVDFLGDFLGLVPALHAGVAHDDVDAAKVRLGLLEQPRDFRDLGDIGLDGETLGSGAELVDLVDDLVGVSLAVGVVDNNVGATAGEVDGDTSANATAGTGDNGDLAFKTGGGDSENHVDDLKEFKNLNNWAGDLINGSQDGKL